MSSLAQPFDRVVLSCNESDLYLDFWPLVSYVYRTLFPWAKITFAFVTERHHDDPFLAQLCKDQRPGDDLALLRPLRDVPQAAQAKLARYFVASCYNEVTLVDDLDQIPIDRDWHIAKLSKRKPDTLFLIGAEVYANEYPDQAPAGMMTAEGHIWRHLFNPDGLQWPEWMQTIADRKDSRPHTNLHARANHEGMDGSTKQELLGPLFSDEALIASLRKERPVEVTSVERGYTVGIDTIDRGCWPFDVDRLEAGDYISAHTARPLRRFVDGNFTIADYIRRRYDGETKNGQWFFKKTPSVDPDMEFGGSGLVKEAFEWIVKNVPARSTILELGSGHVSTSYLSRYYRVVSVEHDLQFVNLYPAHYIYAPLVDDHWFDPKVVQAELKHRRVTENLPFGLLIIDGPVGGTKRLGVLDHLDILPLDCPVLVDDTWRAEETFIANEIARRTGRPVQRFEYFSII